VSPFAILRLSYLNSGSTEILDAYPGDGIVKNESSLQSSAAFGPREVLDRNHGGTQHDRLHPFEVTTTIRPCETSDSTESNHERRQQQPMTRPWKGLPPALAQLQIQEYILNLQRQQQIQQHLRERQQCQTSLGKLPGINNSPSTNSRSLGETDGLKRIKSDNPLASNDTLSDLCSTGPDPRYNHLSQHFTPHKTGDKKESAFLPQGKEKHTWSSSVPENTLAEPAQETSLPIPDNGKELSPHHSPPGSPMLLTLSDTSSEGFSCEQKTDERSSSQKMPQPDQIGVKTDGDDPRHDC